LNSLPAAGTGPGGGLTVLILSYFSPPRKPQSFLSEDFRVRKNDKIRWLPDLETVILISPPDARFPRGFPGFSRFRNPGISDYYQIALCTSYNIEGKMVRCTKSGAGTLKSMEVDIRDIQCYPENSSNGRGRCGFWENLWVSGFGKMRKQAEEQT
jgi:hypothetical protein